MDKAQREYEAEMAQAKATAKAARKASLKAHKASIEQCIQEQDEYIAYMKKFDYSEELPF